VHAAAAQRAAWLDDPSSSIVVWQTSTYLPDERRSEVSISYLSEGVMRCAYRLYSMYLYG